MAEEGLVEKQEQEQEAQVEEQVSEQEAEEQVVEEKPKKKKQTAQERIDEVVFKQRETERQFLAEKEARELLLEQNKKLLERFDAFEGRFEDDREPDRFEQPKEHDEWLMRKIKRELTKETPSKDELQKTTGPKIGQERLQTFEAAMATLHDDYYQVVEDAKKDMVNDSLLRSEILNSDNPPKKAYDYVMKKRERAKQQRETELNQDFVEGGGGGGPANEPKELTQEQKRVADKMGISHENYKKQLDIIEGRA